MLISQTSGEYYCRLSGHEPTPSPGGERHVDIKVSLILICRVIIATEYFELLQTLPGTEI